MIGETELQECIAGYYHNAYVCCYSVCVLVAFQRGTGKFLKLLEEKSNEIYHLGKEGITLVYSGNG